MFTREKTRRSETSQYPEEKKETSIPLVAASEKGRAQTRYMFKPERVVYRGLRGPLCVGSDTQEMDVQLV